eukprot:9090765-Pyramimonas_sp.AAC.1
MLPRPPESPTRAEVPSRQRGPRDALRSLHRHRGRVDRADLAGPCARESARQRQVALATAAARDRVGVWGGARA